MKQVKIIINNITINLLETFSAGDGFILFLSFIGLFILSFLFGIAIGVISAYFLKKMKYFNLNRVQECSIIIFFAFISYTVAELISLSPIISLLITGMFMSHYSFFNLSFQAREESR